MTVHLVTEEITIKSQILVSAPPGERPERVIEKAMEEYQKVRDKVGLVGAPTDLHIIAPVVQEGRRWSATIEASFRSTECVTV